MNDSNSPLSELESAEPLDVLRRNVPLDGARVLDVGCGNGWLSRELMEQAVHVSGIDPSPDQLRLANAAGSFENVVYLEGVGELLPLADGSVDIVIYYNSLHHVAGHNQEKALREAGRVLNAGGYLYIQEPVATGPCYELCRGIDDEGALYAHAQRVIGAVAHGLEFAQTIEEWFLMDYVYADFEALCSELSCVDSSRDEKLKRCEQTLRLDFDRLGRRQADGWHFGQVQRINVLRKC